MIDPGAIAAALVLGLAWVLAELRASAATRRADDALRSEAATARRLGVLEQAVAGYRAAVRDAPKVDAHPDVARAAQSLDDALEADHGPS